MITAIIRYPDKCAGKQYSNKHFKIIVFKQKVFKFKTSRYQDRLLQNGNR